MPKLSIIIPIFNTQNYILQCLESCKNISKDSHKIIEIIIIDDKSTDDSLKIIESFIKNNKEYKIKLIKNNINKGTFLTRNEGIKIASGEFILFLDSDDCLAQNCIDILLQNAYDNNSDIVNFGIIHNPKKKFATLPKIHTEILTNENIIKKIIIDDFKTSWLNLCGRIYKTSLVKKAAKKLELIDRHLISSEDTILFFVICLLAQKSSGVDNNSYIYCQNIQSITRVKAKDKLLKQIEDRLYLKNALLILDKDIELNSHPNYKKAKENILNMLNYFICYSKRFLNKKDLIELDKIECKAKRINNCIISPYIKYSILSMKYIPRWQIMIKLAIFIATFGSKKL